jgi:hypothetical protein
MMQPDRQAMDEPETIEPLTLAKSIEIMCRNYAVSQLELTRLYRTNSELKAEVEKLKGQASADGKRFASGWYWIKRPFDPCSTIVCVANGVVRFGNGDEITVDKANLDGKTKWYGPMTSPLN